MQEHIENLIETMEADYDFWNMRIVTGGHGDEHDLNYLISHYNIEISTVDALTII